MATAIATLPIINEHWWRTFYRRKPVIYKLSEFSVAGDTVLAEWEVGNVEAEDFARGIYKEAKAKKWGLALVTPEGSTGVSEFNPRVGDHILLRPIAGG